MEEIHISHGHTEEKQDKPTSKSVWILCFVITIELVLAYQVFGGLILATLVILALAFAMAFIITACLFGMLNLDARDNLTDDTRAVAIVVTICSVLLTVFVISKSGTPPASTEMIVFTAAGAFALSAVAILFVSFLEHKDRKWIKYAQVTTIAFLFVVTTLTPPGVILNSHYVTEWTLVNPFNMDGPLVIAPNEGDMSVTNMPEGWTASVRYEVEDPTKVSSFGWKAMIDASVPFDKSVVLKMGEDPKAKVQEWLRAVLPNVKTSNSGSYTPPTIRWN